MPRRRRWYPARASSPAADLADEVTQGVLREFGPGILASVVDHLVEAGHHDDTVENHQVPGEVTTEELEAGVISELGAGVMYDPADDIPDAEGLTRRDRRILGLEQAEVQESRTSPLVPSLTTTFRRRTRGVPPMVTRLVRTLDVPVYRIECLDEIEQLLFGWEDDREKLGPIEIIRCWDEAMSRPRREETLGLVRRVVDRRKRLGYVRKLQDLDRQKEPLPFEWRPGSLVCEDPQERTEPTFGVRSFMEATPVQVVAFAIEVLTAFGSRKPKKVLDLTTGSGTVTDLVRAHGGHVVERDLDPVRDGCLPLDLREVERAVPADRRFDAIFVHPPSIGTPHPMDPSRDPGRRDLSWATPEQWTEVVSTAVTKALTFLHPGHGLLSLLVPEGVRDHQKVHAYPGMADQILQRLPENAYVVDRRPLTWRRRAKQVSLGTNRVPSVHLLIARETWP